MKAIDINNTRIKLYQMTNSIQKEIHELNEQLNHANATDSERNEFKELLEIAQKTISTANALAGNDVSWSKIKKVEKPIKRLNPNVAGEDFGFFAG